MGKQVARRMGSAMVMLARAARPSFHYHQANRGQMGNEMPVFAAILSYGRADFFRSSWKAPSYDGP
jgi:hypothetical protein